MTMRFCKCSEQWISLGMTGPYMTSLSYQQDPAVSHNTTILNRHHPNIEVEPADVWSWCQRVTLSDSRKDLVPVTLALKAITRDISVTQPGDAVDGSVSDANDWLK